MACGRGRRATSDRLGDEEPLGVVPACGGVAAPRHGRSLAAAPRGRLLPAPVQLDAGDQALMDQAIRYYQERLKQTPEALAYLARRGLDDAELIEQHRLGFADRTLGLRLPEKTRKAGHEIRSRLQKLGLLRDSGHEHFNGSSSSRSSVRVVRSRKSTAARSTTTCARARRITCTRRVRTAGCGTRRRLNPHRDHPLRSPDRCAHVLARRLPNVTSAYGIEGITPDHLAAFKQHGTGAC